MTEGKQSDNTREKVSYILVAQDLDNTNAGTFDTFYNAEDKNYKSLRVGGGGGDSGSFKFLYTAMQIKRKQKKRLEKKRETISNKERKKRKEKKEKKRKRSIKN